jgi:Ig-like domain from next to BRCA1 gene
MPNRTTADIPTRVSARLRRGASWSSRTGSLTVACLTAGPGPRVAALLDSLRPAADEILVALDDRAEPEVGAAIASVADRVVVYPYAEPVDRPLPWLFAQAQGDWVLFIDDDEIPSLALIEALPSLCADDSVVHYSLPRRWLHPEAGIYLDEAPWRPDYGLRLVRTDARLVQFSDEFHRPITAAGPGRFLELPLWHADPILRTFEHRSEKARRYERIVPGLRVGGLALNFAFYLPELYPDARRAAVPDAERTHIESILGAPPPQGPERAVVDRVESAEIDRHWPVSDPAAQSGSIELLEDPGTLAAGEQRTLDVRVLNTGSAAWPWGSDCRPEIQVGSRWFGPDGREIAGVEIHTALPAALAPGEAQLVPVHVRAPARTGRYRVAIDLVHEHQGRFGTPQSCWADVRARRRVAVLGDDDAVRDVAELLEAMPEVELVRLRRTPAERPAGYPEAPDFRAFLFDGAPSSRIAFAGALLWRSMRLRFGPTPPRAAACVDVLRDCELLIVAGPDGPTQRRERWAAGVLARAARSRGVAVRASRDASELLRLLTR